MSVEAWIIEETEQQEREERRRREEAQAGIHLPRTPGEDGPRAGGDVEARPARGRVEVVEISPGADDNVIDL